MEYIFLSIYLATASAAILFPVPGGPKKLNTIDFGKLFLSPNPHSPYNFSACFCIFKIFIICFFSFSHKYISSKLYLGRYTSTNSSFNGVSFNSSFLGVLLKLLINSSSFAISILFPVGLYFELLFSTALLISLKILSTLSTSSITSLSSSILNLASNIVILAFLYFLVIDFVNTFSFVKPNISFSFL
ncbi:hypothetical protein CNEONATNEC32_02498 [Clostridium neonatale]|nr:hypothetical protein CNEONATNEC32_02498 [Clostridium neonatale]